jgi:hypothetical protein
MNIGHGKREAGRAIMRVTERLELAEQIACELQSRYTFAELDRFLSAFGIDVSRTEWGNSKRVYARDILSAESEELLRAVAEELDMDPRTAAGRVVNFPEAWRDTTDFRLFISHISKDKAVAHRLKEALAAYSIAGFVAHDDIEPTSAWEREIERGLLTMDAMVAVLTEGFSKSHWCQQEVGFALGRGAKVISFKWGEDPVGFLSKDQALPRRSRTADEIAVEIDRLLAKDSRTAGRLTAAKGTKDDDVPF